MQRHGTTDTTLVIARILRRDKTPAERKLWRALREFNAGGDVHFRQQAPIGHFIADFCEHTRKLIIEVDGGQHNEPENVRRDAERTAWLHSRGYRVIRFSNIDVFKNLESVIIAIQIATGILPADSSIVDASVPSPLAGEGQGGGEGAARDRTTGDRAS